MDDQERIKKVIKGLECCLPPHDPDCDLCPYVSIDLRCRAKLHEDVMALLKEQEPVVPIHTGKHTRVKPITFEYKCIICDTGLMKHWVCCPSCGRKVNWG